MIYEEMAMLAKAIVRHVPVHERAALLDRVDDCVAARIEGAGVQRDAAQELAARFVERVAAGADDGPH